MKNFFSSPSSLSLSQKEPLFSWEIPGIASVCILTLLDTLSLLWRSYGLVIIVALWLFEMECSFSSFGLASLRWCDLIVTFPWPWCSCGHMIVCDKVIFCSCCLGYLIYCDRIATLQLSDVVVTLWLFVLECSFGSFYLEAGMAIVNCIVVMVVLV